MLFAEGRSWAGNIFVAGVVYQAWGSALEGSDHEGGHMHPATHSSTSHRRPARRALALALAASIAVVGSVLATPASGTISAAILASGQLGIFKVESSSGTEVKAKVSSKVVVQTITFQPGSSSGWHSHPGPTLVAVQSGTMTVYHNDCTGQSFVAGQGWVEGHPRLPGLARNEGSEPAVVYVSYLVDSATVVPSGLRIDEANPGCPGLN
jgi:quercetin dioxygenase-like cupin family protein